jgi:tight adherence protein B
VSFADSAPIPFFLSLAFGLGVLFLYMGLSADPASQPAGDGGRGRLARLRDRGVDEFLVRAGLWGVSPREFALFSAGAGAACALLAQLFFGWALVSGLAFALGLAAPAAYYVRRHDRRRAVVQEALADAVAQLRDGIRSGLAVQEAFVALAETGPEALRPEFGRVAADAQVLGFGPALDRAKARLADPLFDVVCAALALNDELGGRNVSGLLGQLADATRGQLRVQEELRAQQAHNVLSARIVAAIPLVLLGAIRTLNPRYVAIFDTLPGQLVLAACGVSVALGYAAMLWTTRLPEDRRVLA